MGMLPFFILISIPQITFPHPNFDSIYSWNHDFPSFPCFPIKPSTREVIWVIGKHGNEGKSWFQEYMESKFGWGKVICGMDIKMKKGSICHVLSKRSLMTIDTFLFDVGKANTDDGVNYELLEK